MALQAIVPAPRPDEPRSFRRIIDGVTLHWLEYGETGRLPPVVLLHGLNDSHLTWRWIAPELARDRRVFVLDLPGHGLSDRPDAGYELAWYSSHVAGWMRSLRCEPVDVVGHSFGGGIALTLLSECRPRIRRLVLAAPGGLGREVAFALRLASLPGILEWIGQPFMGMGTRVVLRRLKTRLPLDHIAELSAMNARRGAARAFARTAKGVMSWRGQRHSFLRHVHEIEQLPPMAILWGDRDTIVPIAHGRALLRAIDGVKLEEFAGCGHYLHHDNPRSFERAVRDALDAAFWPPVRLRVQGAIDHMSDSPALRLAPVRSP